jgi:DNA-binding MarR family transcriptional regulator
VAVEAVGAWRDTSAGRVTILDHDPGRPRSQRSFPPRDRSAGRELADAVGIRRATLSHHQDGMEAAGQVTRRRDPASRRISLVEMTEEGTRLFLRLREAAVAHDQRLRAGLSDEEVARLATLLDTLAANATT